MLCLDASLDCHPAALCPGCYGRDLFAKRGQAEVIGQCWAEEVARDPVHRGQASWPNDDKAFAIAQRKVASLASDPRMVDELAWSAIVGAAAWWARRPERYR